MVIAKLAKLEYPLQREETNFVVHVLQVYERIKLKVSRLTNMHQKLKTDSECYSFMI